jgi:phosphoribosylamine--glycine ligase
VIEFNARFGDPETQVVLARLRTPLGQLLRAVAVGGLDEVEPLRWSADHAVTVVLAAPGYPGSPRTGGVLDGLAEVGDDVQVMHAGTAFGPDGTVVAAGGRVLSVVALGADLDAARDRAYAALGTISLEGGHHRSDIALAASRGEVAVPGVHTS